jgi:flagellar hook assembly protein FlgD
MVTIPFNLDQTGMVEVGVYDVRGRRVKRLLSGLQEGGRQEIVWDGSNESGESMPSGSYFCVLSTEQTRATTRVMIVR